MTTADVSPTLAARISPRVWLLAIPVIVVAQAALLLAMGHSLICPCGTLKLWHGVTHSPENSQQLLDWYSLTHVVHGISFYFMIWAVWRRAPFLARLALAVLIEGGWEILENSEFVINRYREQTMWREYYGDSVVNSVSDTGMMMIGFVLAWRLPVLATVALAAALEGILLAVAHDSLFLNVVMLIYPIDSVKAWQQALPLP